MSSKRIKIPGRLESAETGNVVAGADAIMDDTRGKKQVVVNNEVEAAILSLGEGKQNKLTFDNTPTEESTNPVTSGGVYAADKVLSDAIEAILLLIPSAATALNKLVDMATMNSSIATATAAFKGTYNLVSDLHLAVDATHTQIGAALDALSLDADNNDYAFVQVPNSATDPTEIKKTERYKFNGTNWAYEYDLNNSGFTSAQWNAINSAITAALVTKLTELPTNSELVQTLAGKQDNLTFDNVPMAGSNNPVKSGGIYTRNAEIVGLINALDTAKQDVLTFDNTPTDGSSNPVKSGGVYLAISALQATIVALDAAKQDMLTFDTTPTLGSTNPVTSSGIKTELNRIDSAIVTLDNLYRALTQSSLVVVVPTDTWPVASPDADTIYRVIDRVNTPPQYYSDYMWDGSGTTLADFILMAQYNNAIDDEPTCGSNNLVKSGGVYGNIRNIVGDLFTIADSTVRSNGSIVSSDGYLCTDYLPITGVDDIILKGVWGGGTGTIVPLAYYDSNKAFISALTGYPLGDQDITIGKANIPQNAKFIRCTSAGIVPNRAIVGGVNIDAVIQYSESLHQQSAKDIQEIFLNLKKKEVLIPSSVTENTVIVNGEVSSNNSVDVVNFEVTEGKSYLFSGEMPSSYSGFYFITWYNNNEQVIGGSAYISASTHIVKSLVVVAPAGAVTAKINRHHTYKAECWLKDIDGYFADLIGSCGILPSCNVGNVRSNGVWCLLGTNSYTDAPEQTGFLKVSFLDKIVFQEFIGLSSANYYKRYCSNGSAFGVWQQISGGGNTYNVTNNFTNVEQTVNLTASPQITADTNNYLAPSGDETDRTSDILAMLQASGVCRLGTGEYWVDSLVMPVGSAIIGSGKSTKVCLKSGDNKFAIKMNSDCVVKDLSVIGDSSSISLSSEIGTRHGILWQGNYTETQNTALQPLRGHVSNVFIKWFTGGGITCQDTGVGTTSFIEGTDVVIERCCAGLNIYYYSEFHKFTNVACRECFYGCINNGGNNVFVNCDFSLNRGVGFLMDNSQGQSPNNSHGTCVGCEFHHNRTEDSVSVLGIHIMNCGFGFIFNSCQISDKILIEDSTGISITSCNVFEKDIAIDGGNTILLANNLHFSPPANPITVLSNQKVKVLNCYDATTGNTISL